MKTLPVLRTSSRADLLAIPSYLFGFRPTESTVIIGMRRDVVQFSARLDASWFTTHFDQVADQVLNATAHMGDCVFFVLGYSADLELASISAAEAADVVGRCMVAEVLITDGTRYWSLTDGEGPLPFSFDSSPITAQAVYRGVNIHATREEAVAPVVAWASPDPDAVDQLLEEIGAMTQEAAMHRLADLAEADPPVSGGDALMLACLLLDEDRSAAVLTRISMSNAPLMWANLVAARQVSPGLAEATVVALLAVACWLSGHGAQATSCIEQLAELDPRHPIGCMIATVHQLGIPPQRWDEQPCG